MKNQIVSWSKTLSSNLLKKKEFIKFLKCLFCNQKLPKYTHNISFFKIKSKIDLALYSARFLSTLYFVIKPELLPMDYSYLTYRILATALKHSGSSTCKDIFTMKMISPPSQSYIVSSFFHWDSAIFFESIQYLSTIPLWHCLLKEQKSPFKA